MARDQRVSEKRFVCKKQHESQYPPLFPVLYKMSFLNTIRGFGRNSKKNKKDLDTGDAFYAHSNHSGTSPIRRGHSPTKISPTKQIRGGNQIHFAHPSSPTRRNRAGTGSSQGQVQQVLPKRQSASSSASQKEELPLFMCEPFVKTALVKGSFKTIVQLPKYVDYCEWVALNIFEFYNNLNQFYGVFAEYMTPEAYPTMNAGPNTNYHWIEGSGPPINLPAGQYIEYVLSWISSKLNDQSVFPTKNGGAFPPNFMKDCKNIMRQMFRIFAHIYHNHFDKIVHLSLEAHWNSFFAHFVSFAKEYNLIDRSEMEPLLPLIENFELQGKII